MRASIRSSPVSPGMANTSDFEPSSEPSKVTHSKIPFVCGIEGCHSPVFQSAPRPGVKLLCKRHETEERHKNAAAQRRPMVTSERPIKKNKLYTYKPDADMDRKLKRKRDLPKSTTFSSSLGSKEESTSGPHSQDRQPTRVEAIQNKLVVNVKSRSNIALESLPDIPTSFQFTPPPEITHDLTSSIIKSNDSPRPHSTKGSVPGLKPTAPSQDVAVLVSPGAENGDSPGLQIAQELEEIVEKQNIDSKKVVRTDQLPQTGQIPQIDPLQALGGQFLTQCPDSANDQIQHTIKKGANKSCQQRNNSAQSGLHATASCNMEIENEVSVSNGRIIPGWVGSSPQESAQILRQQPKIQQKTFTQKESIQQSSLSNNTGSTIPNLYQIAPSIFTPTTSSHDLPMKELPIKPPYLPLSPSTTSNDMLHDDSVVCSEPLAVSLEARRQHMASTYDCTYLDTFLENVEVASYRELKDQEWGHIDPRTAWPPDFPETREEEEGKAEEEAVLEDASDLSDILDIIRPKSKRKVNYGKHLTRQVVSARKHARWDTHQSKEVTVDKLGEGAAVLEELFGIKDIDDLEPGSHNSKFGMKRKMPASDERRKGKDFFYQLEGS